MIDGLVLLRMSALDAPWILTVVIVPAFVLCGIGVAAIVRARWKTGDFVNPAAIVIAAWSVSMDLFLLRMLPHTTMSTWRERRRKVETDASAYAR